MSRLLLLFTSVALVLSGCGKKTAAELQEEERQKIREQKRLAAIAQYKRLAQEYPENEHANKAADRAKTLEAQTKK
jgi:hypothetical protein